MQDKHQKTLHPHNKISNQLKKAILLADNGKGERALKILFEIISQEKSTDLGTVLTAYNRVGIIYGNLDQSAKAEEYYQKACILAEQNKRYLDLAYLTRDRANNLRSWKKYDVAEYYFLQALELTEKYWPEEPHKQEIIGIIYSKLAATYAAEGKVDQAREAFDQGRTILEKTNHEYFKIITSLDYLAFCLEQSEYETILNQADILANRALRLKKGLKAAEAYTLGYQAAQKAHQVEVAAGYKARAEAIINTFDNEPLRDRFLAQLASVLIVSFAAPTVWNIFKHLLDHYNV